MREISRDQLVFVLCGSIAVALVAALLCRASFFMGYVTALGDVQMTFLPPPHRETAPRGAAPFDREAKDA